MAGWRLKILLPWGKGTTGGHGRVYVSSVMSEGNRSTVTVAEKRRQDSAKLTRTGGSQTYSQERNEE